MPLSSDEEKQDRLDYIENEKRLKGTTFVAFAESDNSTPRGRFTEHSTASVVGSTPVPQYPKGPAWCAADQGLEPPLGYSVEDHEPVGRPFEVAASVASNLGPSLPSDQATPSASVQSPPLRSSKRSGPVAGAGGSLSTRTYRRV